MKVYESIWLDLAARQHGVISHAQLVADGLSPRQVQFRVDQGRLMRVHRGVFRLAGMAATFEQRLLAGCLAANGVASHRAAAALWSLRGCESGTVEVSVPGRRRPELLGVVGHTTADLPNVDRTERCHIPVTTPARTLIDLATVAPIAVVEGAVEDAFHRHLVTRAWLDRVLSRPAARTRPGVGRLSDLLAGRDPAQRPTESTLEDVLVGLIRGAGLPEPTRQHPVGPYRIDVSYPSHLIAIECQSLKWHTSKEDVQRDCDKRNLLVRRGWRVLVFTWADANRRPGHVAEVVRAALAA